MFVQVITGKVSDAGEARQALESWYSDLAPGATGWLGCTSGVTEDGRFVSVVRFASEEAAQSNSDRPEQGAWWTQTSKLFTSEPVFKNSIEVTPDLSGDPDQAGFVQVMQGKSSDPDRARELMNQDSGAWAVFRPEVLGSLEVDHADGEYTMAIYFTSQEEAREGEKKEIPAELKEQMAEMGTLSVGETAFYDLSDPWLYAPR